MQETRYSLEERLLLIRNCDFFSSFSEEEIQELEVIHHYLEVSKGEYIYFDPQQLNRLFFTKKGHIRIGRIDEHGNDHVKEIIRPGQIFGQFTLEAGNPDGEYALAYKDDVSLCSFRIRDFENLLQLKPQLSLQYSKLVAGKLKRYENRLLSLLNRNVKDRLVFFFLQLAELEKDQAQRLNTNGYRFGNYLTHEDIAGLIGSTRQTVTSLISELQAEGLLEFNRQEIIIPDLPRLQSAYP